MEKIINYNESTVYGLDPVHDGAYVELFTEGYFSNDDEFKVYEKGTLNGITYLHGDLNFITSNGDKYDYFIPADECVITVKPEVENDVKTKLRPFYNITEFKQYTNIGDFNSGNNLVVMRYKNDRSAIRYEQFSGYMYNSDIDYTLINIGGSMYTLNELFNNYEFLKDNVWNLFGTVDKD